MSDFFDLHRKIADAKTPIAGFAGAVKLYDEDPDIRSLTSPTVWVSFAGGIARLKAFDGAQIVWLAGSGMATRADADITLSARDAEWQFFPTLTANRSISLPLVADKNKPFYIVRDAVSPGSGTLNVGGIKTMPASTRAVVEVRFDGTAFRQVRYSTL